jgi:hypothetical protein
MHTFTIAARLHCKATILMYILWAQIKSKGWGIVPSSNPKIWSIDGHSKNQWLKPTFVYWVNPIVSIMTKNKEPKSFSQIVTIYVGLNNNC